MVFRKSEDINSVLVTAKDTEDIKLQCNDEIAADPTVV